MDIASAMKSNPALGLSVRNTFGRPSIRKSDFMVSPPTGRTPWTMPPYCSPTERIEGIYQKSTLFEQAFSWPPKLSTHRQIDLHQEQGTESGSEQNG